MCKGGTWFQSSPVAVIFVTEIIKCFSKLFIISLLQQPALPLFVHLSSWALPKEDKRSGIRNHLLLGARSQSNANGVLPFVAQIGKETLLTFHTLEEAG